MTPDDFRQLALSIPGCVEKAHVGHPDFRLHGRIFASLGAPDETWGMVKLTPAQQASFLKRASRMFSPCAGAWGRQGYTNVLLAAASAGMVRAGLRQAAANMKPSAPKRSRTKS